MANIYAPGIKYQAGQIVSVPDPTDATAPNKLVVVPLVANANASGSVPPAGTSADPTFVSTSDGAGAKTDRSISVSTASQQAAAANSSRKRILVQNQDGAINVFVNLGAPANAGQGSMRIGPGAFLDIEGTTQALNIIAASGTPAVTIWEF